MITLEQYLKDSDGNYPPIYSQEIEDNAKELLEAVNALLDELGVGSVTVSSGLRTPEKNAKLPNAGPKSFHLFGLAIDIADPHQYLARLILTHEHLLDLHDLYLENPMWTPTHVHLQRRPPPSKKRIFIPNNKPPLTGPLI